ncbi:hypothetical protein ARMSODRAFT_1026023 [Armillaria solidipes]|uniref:Ribonuclease H1 N-terminal domain-containing protein n=1 Tax=Armillaria solidipes TaxID=1076256 RepID=A0A2H3AQ68_9AGAR|nr:hypothetical protein ARMSODRAFT_1026023 [Armillaria solidipes]
MSKSTSPRKPHPIATDSELNGSMEIILLTSDDDGEGDMFFDARSAFSVTLASDGGDKVQPLLDQLEAVSLHDCMQYVVSMSTNTHVMADWSEAAHIIDNNASAQAHAIVKHKRKRIRGPKVYVVFMGIPPGICTTWAECQRHMKGISQMLYKTYRGREAAERAYSYALDWG